jgi:hypothetical protein
MDKSFIRKLWDRRTSIGAIPAIVLVVGLAGLAGCASLNFVESDVSTYSQWPAERKATTFAFERLPSQQARPQEQTQLESQARVALASAGFREAGDAKDADVTVQVGARVSRSDPMFYDDPFWYRSSIYHSRFGRPLWGPGFMYDHPRYEREVAVLIRDRKSNQPLYEARASSDGLSSGTGAVTSAMFIAAMKDFRPSARESVRTRRPLSAAAWGVHPRSRPARCVRLPPDRVEVRGCRCAERLAADRTTELARR